MEFEVEWTVRTQGSFTFDPDEKSLEDALEESLGDHILDGGSDAEVYCITCVACGDCFPGMTDAREHLCWST